MSVIRLTKEFSFESAHVLEGYDGACSQIHGHSYKLFVTVKGKPSVQESDPKLGMVMDFRQLKKIVKDSIIDIYDHSIVIRKTDTNGDFLRGLKTKFERVIVTEYQPTCENMIADFAAVISSKLPDGIILYSLKMHETETSYAEWYGEDNQ